MKKGYILIFSLKLFIIISSLYLVKFNQVQTTAYVYNQAQEIYARLDAENFIFEEVLFRMSIYDEDDFSIIYEDYLFDVKLSETIIKIKVDNLSQYSIKLTYDDDCICFTEFLYN
ncbi:MAG: hypothetical protein GX769_02735 [Erysipelothrix sp.]|nr:hypothetical protein [Erysipelothrix sp.]